MQRQHIANGLCHCQYGAMLQPIPLVVVSYKNPEAVEKFFASVNAQTYPVAQMQWDNSDDNRYVSYGWNRAILSVMADAKYNEDQHTLEYKSPYVIVATQEVELEKNCVNNLAAFMDAHPRCAIAGVKQIGNDMVTIINAGGANSIGTDRNQYGQEVQTGGSRFCGVLNHEDANCRHEQSLQRPWVNGALMILRLAAIQEVGIFDENFRLIHMDADLCYSARARGWEVWYCADAVAILHDYRQSGYGEDYPNTAQVVYDDLMFFKHKWAGSSMFMRLMMEHNPAFLPTSFPTVSPEAAAMMKRRQESPMMATPEQTLEYLDRVPLVEHAATTATLNTPVETEP